MSRGAMREAWRRRPLSTFLATGAGIGMMPVAPGTWGSALGLALAALIESSFASGALAAGACAAVVLAVGVAASGRAEAAAGEKDPGAIVVDEIAGQLLAAAPVALFPLRAQGRALLLLAAFGLFRLFDIWKPGPIRRLQDLPGGWGIMLDDVAAGACAALLTGAAGWLGA